MWDQPEKSCGSGRAVHVWLSDRGLIEVYLLRMTVFLIGLPSEGVFCVTQSERERKRK